MCRAGFKDGKNCRTDITNPAVKINHLQIWQSITIMESYLPEVVRLRRIPTLQDKNNSHKQVFLIIPCEFSRLQRRDFVEARYGITQRKWEHPKVQYLG